MPAQTAQINVMLSNDLKQAGDAALVEAGLSSSQIVRALWRGLAQRGKMLDDIRRLLLPNDAPGDAQGSVTPPQRGWAVADRLYGFLGYDPESMPLQSQAWDELYRATMSEYFEEKGLFA